MISKESIFIQDKLSSLNLLMLNLNEPNSSGSTSTNQINYPITSKLHDNNQYLISALSNYGLSILDVNSFKIIGNIPLAHEKRINDIFIDENCIYTCSNDGTIKLWDLRDLGLKATLKGIDPQILESS